MQDANNNVIKWEFLKKLVNIQEKYGLHLATKIRKRHIDYQKEKMKVKLAVQIFSNSVGIALQHCEVDLKLKEFVGVEPTSTFCILMDKMFDVLNTRNNLSKNPFKKGLTKFNFSFISNFFDKCISYISNLRTKDNVNILQSRRKIGFLGMIVTMNSIRGIVENYICSKIYFDYLLTYKLSQDHIELFFHLLEVEVALIITPQQDNSKGHIKDC